MSRHKRSKTQRQRVGKALPGAITAPPSVTPRPSPVAVGVRAVIALWWQQAQAARVVAMSLTDAEPAT